MLPCVAERIAGGASAQGVGQQQCVWLKTIGRKTKIDMCRLIDVAHGGAILSEDELAAIARELAHGLLQGGRELSRPGRAPSSASRAPTSQGISCDIW
jgi:hypothetical protein